MDWHTFCELSGHAELITDSRFAELSQRVKNIEETYAVTDQIVREKSQQEWLDLLGETSVPLMVVNRLDDLLQDPHLLDVGFWQLVEHPEEGQLLMSSPPVRFGKTPARIAAPPPRLGEHSREVLQEVGIENAAIDAMMREGVTVEPV